MTTSTVDKEISSLWPAIIRRLIQVVVLQVIWFAIFFGAAGSLSWPRAWYYAAFWLLLYVVNFAYVIPRNPEVVAERGKKQKGTKGFDKIFGLFFGVAYLSVPLLSGLDAVRYQWTQMPLWMCWLGFAVIALGNVFISWSMATNRHLETSVRIQTDRDHQVISTGPYALMRHPMYVGIILQLLAMPLIMGSMWSAIPVGIAILCLGVRTWLEDTTLQKELKGYKDFTQKTRYRLFPGVW